MFVADVILDSKTRALDRVFSYALTEEQFKFIETGMRLAVPFGTGNRVKIAVVADFYENEDSERELKSIISILDNASLIPWDLLQLSKFLLAEYGAKKIDILKLLLPPGNFKDVERSVYIKQEIFKYEVDDTFIKILPAINMNVGKKLSLESFSEYGSLIYKLIENFPERLSIEVKLKVHEEKKSLWVKKIKDIEIKKNAVKQLAVMENLVCDMPIRELIEKSKSDVGVIRALENKGALEIYEKEEEFKPYPKLTLTPEQEKVFNEILESKSREFLIKGVTGSGKTEVYLHLTEEMLKRGKDIIFLVPEISLTPQMIERFTGRFGSQVAILHSKLTAIDRENQWRKIQNGEVKIVVGARSAVFAPVKDLGLIIIDEEHENTFKSQSGVRYDTLSVASERVKISKGKLVMGSATPDVASYFKTKGEIKLLELKHRISGEDLDTEIVDLREELKNGNPSIISMKLYSEMREALGRGEQIILFLNRKGYSGNLTCRDCGYTVKCDNCDVSMGYYKSKERIKCNYCGSLKKVPETCPECGSSRIGYFGLGTELVEEVIRKLFPTSNICRMDFESTRERNSYERIYRDMLEGKIDILIGTQMVSKGLDFPSVSLVGVLLADSSLNFPDFKSQERTFQLITQVSGRAGRAKTRGKVIIQTFQPKHYAIRLAAKGDYEEFFKNELSIRREFFYPPYSRLLLAGFKGKDRNAVADTAKEFFIEVKKECKDFKGKIFGPVPCFVEWIKGKYRFQILYKTVPQEFYLIRDAVFRVYRRMIKEGVDIIIDVDPISVI